MRVFWALAQVVRSSVDMPADADDEFLTVAEVAGILKLNQQTVRNWI
jgi:hypothetical protein